MRKSIPKIICVVALLWSTTVSGQYNWNWKDPIDLDIVDLGDNKVLLYNAVGVGLSLKFTARKHLEKKEFRKLQLSSFLDFQYEYSRPPKSDVFSGRVRILKQLRKFLKVGGDVVIYRVRDEQVSAVGLGIHAAFNWVIISKPNWRLYYDNGVGPNFFSNPFPYGGTNFNFMTFYGISISHKVPNVAWVTLGIRNIHISNAGIKGKERNPALDGLGLTVGYEFF